MVTECFEILMELLKSRKVKARYLADKMEISVRSVYRYIDVLSASGVAIFCERGRNGGIRIADNYRLPAALLSPSEQSDILAALNLYKGANPACDVENIRGKLLALDTSSDADKLIMTGDKLILEGTIGDEKLYRAKIEPLSEAINKQKKVLLVYHDRGGEITERTVRPHAFVLKDFVWYVYAYCELRESFRMFKISRIEKLAVSDVSFERIPREEFTPLNLSPEKAQIVNILLSVNENARYAVEEWLGVECVRPVKNPLFPFVANAEVACDNYLFSRLLSFGADVRVEEPRYIADKLICVARDIGALYAKKPH